MKVRFENIDRQTPANLAIQVRTLPHEFDGLYFQNAHPDLHPVYSGRQDPTEVVYIVLHCIDLQVRRENRFGNFLAYVNLMTMGQQKRPPHLSANKQ